MNRVLLWVAALIWSAPAFAGADYLGTYVWRTNAEGVGGISGIDVSPDGDEFLAVGDRGRLYQGRFDRKDGLISGVGALAYPLREGARDGWFGQKIDSEGIAATWDGSFYISFEGIHRVRRFAAPGVAEDWLPQPRDFRGFERNGSLEALAIDSTGALYTMAERGGPARAPMRVYRFAGGQWSVPFSVARREDFLPVGADIGPDGRFYLLERRFNGLAFRTRIRRFAMDGTAEKVLLSTAWGQHGNLEGIGIWRDAAGALRATMIADDNFSPLQRTEIVEYRLTDAGQGS